MSENRYNFQKLTPIDDVELNIYEDALKFVFENDDIKNVAISGAYCAGKSSVLESYKKVHTDKRFIHISLAHFEATSENSTNHSTPNESTLEGKIINQLVQKVNPKDIPQTQFKIKRKIPPSKIIINTVLFLIFSVMIAYIAYFEKWCILVNGLSFNPLRDLLRYTTNKDYLLLSSLLCLAIAVYAIFTITKTQKIKSIFRKIKLQGNEIEIFEENKDSYFDKYLNEVLYLFENAKVDAIVFEDMDRYNTNQIFEKLREINDLVYSRSLVKKEEGESVLRFFYLIRDDIFDSKDRTKFFDFIIPVVPVIDGSNSYDQLIDHFTKGGVINQFSNEFLQGLSLYIDDMRLLKNIYNEYVIYHNRIQSTELNFDKILAMIVYKNIFPRDFNHLQLGTGFVYTLFEQKKDQIEKQSENIEEQIRKISNEINSAEEEMLVSIDELDAVYLRPIQDTLYISGKSGGEYESQVKFVRALKANPNQVIIYNNYSGRREPYDINQLFNELSRNTIYQKRKEDISRKAEERIDELRTKVLDLTKQKSKLLDSRLRDLITKDNADEIFGAESINEIGVKSDYKDVKSSMYFDLIKYLIRNGYIDETYQDYMTYFYENSISRTDKIFLRSVTDESPKPYTYSLKKPALVLSRLRQIDFDKDTVLNFDLVEFLLKNKEQYRRQIFRILDHIKGEINLEFVGQFLDQNRSESTFVGFLNSEWPSVWESILQDIRISESQKNQYALDFLMYSENIQSQENIDYLKDYISSNPAFLDIENPDIEQIVSSLALLNIKFASIDYHECSHALFYEVYKNNLYQLSYLMISLMLKIIYKLPDDKNIRSKNYSLIASKPKEPLYLYVKDNITEYMKVNLENCGNLIDDYEVYALELLNNQGIDCDLIEIYVNYLNTKIRKIKDVTNESLWNQLIQYNKVCYTCNNILNYFFLEDVGFNDLLINFINCNEGKLNYDIASIRNEFGENAATDFNQAVIRCNGLTDEKYREILHALNIKVPALNIADIKDEKVMILVDLRIVQMTKENLQFFRENYSDETIFFILRNIKEYTNKVICDDNFIFDELLQILNSNVADKYKLKLLQFSSEAISVNSSNLSDMVKLQILENNFDAGDISFLLSAYSSSSANLQEKIYQKAIMYIKDIIEQENVISYDLLLKLLESELDTKIRIGLFVFSLPQLSKIQAKTCLSMLNLYDYLPLFERKRPKIEISDVSTLLLEAFSKEGWITQYYQDKDDPHFYRAFGRMEQQDTMPVEML